MIDLAGLRRVTERYSIATAVAFEDWLRAGRLIRAYVDGVLADLGGA